MRIQFSMQQTNDAHKFIFGAEHNEDSLARSLIRRNSNIIFFDEFDKVNPSFYNAFYQMFDEGIYVDSNYSVDMENCVIICTSNYKNEIDVEKHLGTPIYSRFNKVIVFDDISIENRIEIANNVYESLMSKRSEDEVTMLEGNNIISIFVDAINNGCYKNIRMLKNDMEDYMNYEILKKLEVFD